MVSISVAHFFLGSVVLGSAKKEGKKMHLGLEMCWVSSPFLAVAVVATVAASIAAATDGGGGT